MTQEIRKKLDNPVSELKITFTDPKSGKQLRVFCEYPEIVSENFALGVGSYSSLDIEMFCKNLQMGES